MADKDPIDEFIALPREQQLSTLQSLAPEKQDKLLAQVKTRRQAPAPPAPRPGVLERLTSPDSAEFKKAHPFVSAVSDFGGGAISGASQLIAHPIDSAKGTVQTLGDIGNVAMPEGGSPEEVAASRGRLKQQWQAAKEHPAYALGQLVGQGETGEIGGALAGKAIALAPRVAQAGAEAVTGTGPRVAKTLAKDTAAANAADAAKVAGDNQTAAAKHLEDTQKALHETEGKELTHAQAMQAAKDEAAALRDRQLKSHITEKAKVEAQRQEAQSKFDAAKAKQAKIEPQAQKLGNARSALRAATETAREKALKVGNEKYTAVNEELNPVSADMEAVHSLYHEAAESMGEAQAQPALVKRLGTALEHGAELSYKDLQPIYSELGKELSKGTLPGTTYHAYDVMHEAIGNEMQRIADSKGQGAQLTDARNYWRRMKQTFGKEIRFNDAATKAIGGVKDETHENQIRLLGSFDPEIPKLESHIQNIEKGADSLPKPVPERELTQKLAESRPPIPKAPKPPQPESVKPIERVAPPNRPNEMLPAPKKIGAEDVQAAKAKSMGKRADLVQHKALWIAAGPPIYALVDMLRGHVPNVGEVAAVSAGVGAVSAGVGRLMENPKFVEFMTKATPRDIEAIPPDLRGDFPRVVQAAQAKGIKVSPALGALAASRGLAPRRPEMHPTDAWASTGQQ